MHDGMQYDPITNHHTISARRCEAASD